MHLPTSRRRAPWLALPAIGLAVAAITPAGDVHAGGAGGPMRDGNWAGTMAVGVTIDFSHSGTGLVAQGSGNGTFNLALTGGTAAGDYVLGASSSATLNSADATGQADAVGAITGQLQGTSSAPIFSPAQAHVDVTGSVTVNGFTVPINEGFDFGPADLVTSTLVITSSSCTFASGTWAQEFKAAIQGAGASVTSFQGSWAAKFAGQTPGAQDAALQDILTRGEALLSQWFASGTFDPEALGTVLIDAEHYAIAAPKDATCTGKPGTWASPLSGLVERLLTALANSSSTTAEDFLFGVNAGLRTGNLPSAGGDTLESQMETKAMDLLDQAIAAHDLAAVSMIATAANQLGWIDAETAAAAALGGSQ